MKVNTFSKRHNKASFQVTNDFRIIQSKTILEFPDSECKRSTSADAQRWGMWWRRPNEMSSERNSQDSMQHATDTPNRNTPRTETHPSPKELLPVRPFLKSFDRPDHHRSLDHLSWLPAICFPFALKCTCKCDCQGLKETHCGVYIS